MRLSWCGKVLLGVLVFLVLVNYLSVVLFPVGPGLLYISEVSPLLLPRLSSCMMTKIAHCSRAYAAAAVFIVAIAFTSFLNGT